MSRDDRSWRVRPPAVAGMFYPGDPDELAAVVDADLAAARRASPATGPIPKALIAPHAGFVYSGPIAASAYARLGEPPVPIERVVLLGPAHRVAVRGIGLSSADGWATPLGVVPVDHADDARLLSTRGVELADRALAPEHSLEVHLPFLQRVLAPGWTLVPMIVGGARPELVPTCSTWSGAAPRRSSWSRPT